MLETIIEILQYTIPSLVTGLVAYYFFMRLSISEGDRNKFLLFKENKKITLPIRLQAYERMTLVMERINPPKLLIRITPTSENKELYVQKLVQNIEQEFEHNLSQQIYISEECWNVLVASKNSISQLIKKVSEDISINTAQELRKAILVKMTDSNSPSKTGVSFIKEEVNNLYS